MKNKFKLLWNNKIRLITFLLLTIATICIAFIIPIQQQNNANLIDKGVVVIRGTSMEPTIKDGQVVYVSDPDFSRGAIVAVKNHSTIKYDSSTMPVLLKRIVGLPGETVEITEKGILINGQLLQEDYCSNVDKTLLTTNDIQEVVLSTNEYFLVGDNRTESFDSRNVGAIHATDFLYGVTLEKNDYTYSVEKKNLTTSIIVLIVCILSPIVYFFACTVKIQKKSPLDIAKQKKLKYKKK